MVGLITLGRVVLTATAVAHAVAADAPGRRQNPGFIDVLPTESSSGAGPPAVTAPAVTAPAAPADAPVPTPASTVAPLEDPPAGGAPGLAPLPSTPPPDAAGYLATSVGPLQGPYFGGIPATSPDVAVVSIFLNLFFLGAVVHFIDHRQHPGRAAERGTSDGSTLSGLVAGFCLARVATCALRLVWLGARTSVAVICLELVVENAGAGPMLFLNYQMAKRMIGFYNIRLSLWARAVVDSLTKITVIASLTVAFALHTAGLVLFVLASSASGGRDLAIATVLVQAAAAAVVVLNLSFLGAVVLLRASADHPVVDRCREKSVVFFAGAGLLTTASLSARTAAAAFIWRPVGASSAIFLSKTVYYGAGFGVEVVTVALYAATRIDLLFSKPLRPAWASQPKTPA